ncbi:MAG: hypothetical protein HY961_22280 [Ignavibacteriae bacterium]|nr:hypothetical protein [Ignavibacteriota bacterium]
MGFFIYTQSTDAMVKSFVRIELTQQESIHAAIFGALWGAIEIVIGTALHAARVPFRGIVLSLLAVLVLVCAKAFVRRKGSLLLIGAVAATLKGLSMGGFVLTPMLAIFVEASVAEIAFALFGVRRFAALIAGSLALLYTFSHGLLAQGILFGTDIYLVYFDLFQRVLGALDVPQMSLLALLGGLAFVHAALGVVAALFAWSVAQRAKTLIEETA